MGKNSIEDGRLIIFETRTGSHLYGTNTPASDEDFQGVFLPSAHDLLGIQNCPKEWDLSQKSSGGARNAVGDVDRKFYSLSRFFDLALQGQPGQLELLFAPEGSVVKSSEVWNKILSHRNFFLSKNGIKPFLGFAVSQVHKAVVKGENLVLIQALIEKLHPVIKDIGRETIRDHLAVMDNPSADQEARLFGEIVQNFKNEHGFPMISIAGRNFDPGLSLKIFLDNLMGLEEKYGSRVRAAAEVKYDYKSLSHACRLLIEAEEFLLNGRITLPLAEASFILDVKQGKVDRDWGSFLSGEIERIEKEILPKSILSSQPDRGRANALCVDIQLAWLKDGEA